ncbi:MAG: KEOPS complex subunit Pcc1 [Candidatus Bathyarchaeia archaeon]
MNVKNVEAKIELNLNSKKYLKSLLSALKPETLSILTHRSKVRIFTLNNTLTLKINAKDIVAFRAAINSYLRFIISCYKTLDAIKELK